MNNTPNENDKTNIKKDHTDAFLTASIIIFILLVLAFLGWFTAQLILNKDSNHLDAKHHTVTFTYEIDGSVMNDSVDIRGIDAGTYTVVGKAVDQETGEIPVEQHNNPDVVYIPRI